MTHGQKDVVERMDNYAARTRETMTENQAIAREILRQLGNQFVVLTGSKDFVAIDSGLKFSIGSGAKDGINRVTITLEQSDTYTVEFFRVNVRDFDNPCVLVSKHEDIYNDSLQNVFERATGFYVTLNARH